MSFLIAAIASAALVAGCGGEGDDASAGEGKTYSVEASTTITAANISKARFVPRINKFCRQAWVIIQDNFEEYSGTQDPTLSKQARFAEAIQLSLLAGIDFHIFDNFRVLGAPKGEEREIEEIIGPMQFAVESNQTRTRLHSVAEVERAFDDYNQRARQYGLNDCLVDRSHLAPIEA